MDGGPLIMTSDLLTNKGLQHGRDWESLPADEGPLEWILDHRQGLIQGPLDLEFLRGRRMALVLEPGQMALLLQDKELKAVYLEGAHYLDIGHGTHQVPAGGSLVFLVANGGIHLNWSRQAPVKLGPHLTQALIGGCSLAIDAPARFYHTFLDAETIPEPEFLGRLIDQLVRGILEDILGGLFLGAAVPGPGEIQSRLTRLTPADLDDDLAPCGLTCVNLAVYTAAPPVEDEYVRRTEYETSGQLDGVGHN